MILLGIVLLLLDLVLVGSGWLTTLGVILVVVGVALWALGASGRPVNGRKHYW